MPASEEHCCSGRRTQSFSGDAHQDPNLLEVLLNVGLSIGGLAGEGQFREAASCGDPLVRIGGLLRLILSPDRRTPRLLGATTLECTSMVDLAPDGQPLALPLTLTPELPASLWTAPRVCNLRGDMGEMSTFKMPLSKKQQLVKAITAAVQQFVFACQDPSRTSQDTISLSCWCSLFVVLFSTLTLVGYTASCIDGATHSQSGKRSRLYLYHFQGLGAFANDGRVLEVQACSHSCFGGRTVSVTSF